MTNDLLLAVDSGKCAPLLLLNLSGMFNIVHHDVLIAHLEHMVGLQDYVLSWFRFYPSHKTFSRNVGCLHSSIVPSDCGVPQGSVLGPVIFPPIVYALTWNNFFFHLNVCTEDIKT